MSDSNTIKAARERLEAAKIAVAEADRPTEDEELAELNRHIADLEKFAEMKRVHGKDRVKMHATPMGAIIVKVPESTIFKAFIDAENPGSSSAQQELIQSCVVHPKDVWPILDAYPGMIITLGDSITLLAGYRKAEIEKK